MNAKFLVTTHQILSNGQTIATGLIESGELSPGMIGCVPNKKLKVEILSVAIVDPTPSDQRAKLISIRILNGVSSDLENDLIEFTNE